MNNQQLYPTDMTDSQWNIIKALVPPAKSGGRPRTLDMRMVINAIFYIVVSGIQWRMLPHEYPNWQSVYYYGAMMEHGSGFMIHCEPEYVSKPCDTSIQPPEVWIVKTLVPGVRGYDAGKNVKGRKRHILVDTLGLLLGVIVTAASVSDPAGAKALLQRLGGFCKNLRRIWVDGTYRGELIAWVAQRFRFRLQPVLRPEGQKGFLVLPRRWVVERTFAWLDLHRRLCRDYEVLTTSSEALIYIAMTRLMIRRLAAS